MVKSKNQFSASTTMAMFLPEKLKILHHVTILFAKSSSFLDALASLQKLIKIKSVINVFKILSPIVLQIVKECYWVLESVREFYRVLQSVAECHRVSQSVAECYRVLLSVTEY